MPNVCADLEWLSFSIFWGISDSRVNFTSLRSGSVSLLLSSETCVLQVTKETCVLQEWFRIIIVSLLLFLKFSLAYV